jgi:hypothetical protein
MRRPENSCAKRASAFHLFAAATLRKSWSTSSSVSPAQVDLLCGKL